jgi:transcription antitermination factor NusG
MPVMQQWLVIRTRPRWEKKVAKRLLDKGVETFCPVIKERRQWSDRMKIIESPLLKTYLFVRIADEERTPVRLTEGVVNFVYRNGKPLVVKEKLVQHIRQFQEAHPAVVALEQVPGALESQQAPANGRHKEPALRLHHLNIKLVAAPPVLSNAATDKS